MHPGPVGISVSKAHGDYTMDSSEEGLRDQFRIMQMAAEELAMYRFTDRPKDDGIEIWSVAIMLDFSGTRLPVLRLTEIGYDAIPVRILQGKFYEFASDQPESPERVKGRSMLSDTHTQGQITLNHQFTEKGFLVPEVGIDHRWGIFNQRCELAHSESPIPPLSYQLPRGIKYFLSRFVPFSMSSVP